jgi:hypothetical protein
MTMRYILLIIFIILLQQAYGQQPKQALFSGIILDSDSLPVPEVALINTRNGKTVLTNSAGFFQTEIAENDSLLIHHISFQKKFINENHNGKIILIELEQHELNQVDVGENQEKENLEQTMMDIKRIASLKKPEGYSKKSRQSYFIDQHGTHNNASQQFFGPTMSFDLARVINIFRKNKVNTKQNIVRMKKQ